MHQDRDELLAFARLGMLPRRHDAHAPARPRRDGRWRWRWRRRPPVLPPRPLAPDPAVARPDPLDIHEYLELEFAVGQEGRR
jgi:hypothetical protein